MHTSLDHEKLEVYQQSPEFITWTLPLLDTLAAGASVRNKLDRASISVPLNIAEGKFTSADRCRFFDNARASALERAPGSRCNDREIVCRDERCPDRQDYAGKDGLNFVRINPREFRCPGFRNA